MKIVREPCYIYHTGSRLSAAFAFYLLSWGAAVAVASFLGYVLGVTLFSVAMRATGIEVSLVSSLTPEPEISNLGSFSELHFSSPSFDVTLDVSLSYPLHGIVRDEIRVTSADPGPSDPVGKQPYDLYEIAVGATGLPSGSCAGQAECYGAITLTDMSARVVNRGLNFYRIILFPGPGIVPNSAGRTAVIVAITILVSLVIMYMYALIFRPLVFLLARSGSGTRTYPDPIYARAHGVSSGSG